MTEVAPQYDRKESVNKTTLKKEETDALDLINKNPGVVKNILDNPNKTDLNDQETDIKNKYNAIKDRIKTVNQTIQNEESTGSQSVTYEKPNKLTTIQTTETKTEAKSELKNIGQDNGIIESMDADSLTDIQNKITAGRSINVIGRSDANIFKDGGPNSKLVKQRHSELFTELQKDLPVEMHKTLITPKQPEGAEATEQKMSDRLNEVLAQARAMQALKDIKGKIGSDGFKKLVNNPNTKITTEPHKESRSGTDRGVSVLAEKQDNDTKKLPITRNLQEKTDYIEEVDHYKFNIPVLVQYKTVIKNPNGNDITRFVEKWINFTKKVVEKTTKQVNTKIDENGKKTKTILKNDKKISFLGSATSSDKGGNHDLRSPISKESMKDYASTVKEIEASPGTYGRTNTNSSNTYTYMENKEKKTAIVESAENAPKAPINILLDPVVFSGKKGNDYIDLGKDKNGNDVNVNTKGLLNAKEGSNSGAIQKQIQKTFPITTGEKFLEMIKKGKRIGNEKNDQTIEPPKKS